MKKTNLKACLIACVLAAASSLQVAKAQWTTIGSVISQTDTTKKVSIGTKTNTADLYVYRNNSSSSIGVRSGTGNAILNMDKGSVGSNSAVAYKTSGVTTWNTGLLGNNNYSIKNVVSGSFPLVVTQTDNVGIGTTTPDTKLQVGSYASGGDQFITIASPGGNLYKSGLKIRHFQNNFGWDLYSDERGGFQGLWLNQVGAGISTTRIFVDFYTGNVGIGTSTPAAKLSVAGNIKITDGTQGAGKVLKSDTDGLASWGTLSGTDLVSTYAAADLKCPVVAGSVNTASGPLSVAVSGNYAYVAGLNNMLQVINISNPASPVMVGPGITGSATSIAVSGSYAYLVNQSTGDLDVINISNPASPAIVGSIVLGSSPQSIAVSGNYAYVVLDEDQFQVINITNPASPAIVGSAVTGNFFPFPNGVCILGNYAYVINQNTDGLVVINITNPASPQVTGSASTLNSPSSVAVSGNYAYVVGSTNHLEVFNIFNHCAKFV